MKSDAESKVKVAALKAASNISTMIKDIFHIPPRYKAEIVLSWKTSVAEPVISYSYKMLFSLRACLMFAIFIYRNRRLKQLRKKKRNERQAAVRMVRKMGIYHRNKVDLVVENYTNLQVENSVPKCLVMVS